MLATRPASVTGEPVGAGVTVVAVPPAGVTVTAYEVEPAPGVKLSVAPVAVMPVTLAAVTAGQLT